MACINITMFSAETALDHVTFGFDPIPNCDDESKATSKFLGKAYSSASADSYDTPGSNVRGGGGGCGYSKVDVVSWNLDKYSDIDLKYASSIVRIEAGSTSYECFTTCCPEGGSTISKATVDIPLEGEMRCFSRKVDKEGTPPGCMDSGTRETTENNCDLVQAPDCANPQIDISKCTEIRTCEEFKYLCKDSYTNIFGTYSNTWEQNVKLTGEKTLDSFYNITFGRISKKAEFLANNQPRDKYGTKCGGGKDGCWSSLNNKANLGLVGPKSESAKALLLKPAIRKDNLLKQSKIIKEVKARIIIYTTLDNSQSPPCCGGNFNGEILAQQDFTIKVGEISFKDDYYSTDTYLLYVNSNQSTSKTLYACVIERD